MIGNCGDTGDPSDLAAGNLAADGEERGSTPPSERTSRRPTPAPSHLTALAKSPLHERRW